MMMTMMMMMMARRMMMMTQTDVTGYDEKWRKYDERVQGGESASQAMTLGEGGFSAAVGGL